MIKSVEQPLNETPQPGSPLVLIPVTAEDVAREKQRKTLMFLLITAVVLVLGVYLYKRSFDPMHAQESYDAGVRFYKVARYGQAILSFENAVGYKPDFADAYLMRGRSFVADAQPQRSIQDFTKVIALRPNDAQALLDRATAYLELKNFDAAIADTVKAIGVDPKLALAYNVRGMAVRSSGDPQKAIEDFTKAIELAPAQDFYLQRGSAYESLGDHQRAIADFTQSIGFFPGSPQGYYARSRSRRAIGDIKGAEADHVYAQRLDGR
jgi:tetratricopeptide (TPR) repeat protein